MEENTQRGFSAIDWSRCFSIISKGRQVSNLKRSEILRNAQILMRKQNRNWRRDLKRGGKWNMVKSIMWSTFSHTSLVYVLKSCSLHILTYDSCLQTKIVTVCFCECLNSIMLWVAVHCKVDGIPGWLVCGLEDCEYSRSYLQLIWELGR